MIEEPVLENAPKEMLCNLKDQLETYFNDELDKIWQRNFDVSWEDSQGLFDWMYTKIE